MNFFVPQTKKSQQEATYQAISEQIVDQMRWTIAPRRIFSLRWIHDKKEYYAEVGKKEQNEYRYQIMAIMESNSYLIFTRSESGTSGTTILVNKDEVTEVLEFA